MVETRPTRMYAYLESRLKGGDTYPQKDEFLQKVKNPPYLLDYQTPLEAYIKEVRSLQVIVRREINLKLKVTETNGAPFDHLFDTGWRAVEEEFSRWGVGNSIPNLFINTGHCWVTVASASFKAPYQHQSEQSLKKITAYRGELRERYAPISTIGKAIGDYEKVIEIAGIYCWRNEEEILNEEKEKYKGHQKQFLKDTDLVRKGILSLSMVEGLVHHLEQPDHLAWNHPGD